MKTSQIRIISRILSVLMLMTLFTACGDGSSESSAAVEASQEQSLPLTESNDAGVGEIDFYTETDFESASTADAEVAVSALPEDYPKICEDGEITLSVLAESNFMMQELAEDNGDLIFYQNLSRITGINFEWNMLSGATASEQFNLLVAADDLPEVVAVAGQYSYGTSSAVENDVFLDLAPYLPMYAPDYLSLVQQDGFRQLAFDEEDQIIGFYELGQKELPPNNGVMLRGDWLEEQNIAVPVTYQEYEEALKSLKSAYDLEAPAFMYLTGTNEGYLWMSAGKEVVAELSLNSEGRVIYGPMEDKYREYLQIANHWYEEGLLYNNFYGLPASESISTLIDYFSTDKSAVLYGDAGLTSLFSFNNESAHLVPGYIPRDDKEQQVHLTFGIDDQFSTDRVWALSTNITEDKAKAACMLMNYFYTEEGATFANYGLEGESMVLQEDGTPWYSDLVLNNPDGLNPTQAEVMYTGYMVPCYSDFSKYSITAILDYPEFLDTWASADNSLALPPVELTTAETERYAAVESDVETYLDEVLAKFVIGDLDVDDDAVWQNHVDTLEQLGAQTMIECYQAALDRYNGK